MNVINASVLPAFGPVIAEGSFANYTGQGLVDWFLVIAGNMFLALVVYGLLKAYGAKEWGAFALALVGAAVLAGFIYFPEQAVEFFKFAWLLGFGSK